ncbi:MAG: RNA polymerase-associated protein RapA [Acidobacteriota bacterium]|nr:MAG: RNA polymerase-associated protein RapA [Acidobacteriota bacterium]
MGSYVVGQRFVSEAEPELGLGCVEEIANRRVLVRFPASDTVRQYASGSAPIKRVAFRIGDEVEDDAGRKFRVENVEDAEGILVYRGSGQSLPETELAGTLRFSKPEERLLGGHWDTSRTFDLRRRTLMRQHQTRKSFARGFLGARIELIPHQLYISREIATRPLPRALLADEVGLGKTIEAGLVMHRLLRSGQISRVLVLVPEPLVHQWFVEMLRRFHLSFTLVNESYCEAVQASDPEPALNEDESTNPFLSTQTAIVSLDWVAHEPKRAAEIRAATWDMVVVDEAHHLEGESPAYELVDALSRSAPGLLLLTATPEQLGEENHFARLRLLDSARYPSYERYQEEARHYRKVAATAGRLIDGSPLTEDQARELESLLPARASSLRERVHALLAGDEDVRQPLIEELLDQHGPGRVVFRNARSVLDRVPERRAHGVKLEWPPHQTDRRAWISAFQEFVIDTGDTRDTRDTLPTDAPLEYDYREDPRALWLIELLNGLAPEKVLVLCRFKEKAVALHEALRAKSRVTVGLFHEDLSLLQRDRNAAWFADDDEDGAQALICSEIGSEGRNFQFAHHLVLFDLPLSVELLEQRIGRLYRIGQEHTVEIYVPYLPGSPQEILYLWYQQGLDALEKSLPSGAYFDELAELVRELALEHIETATATEVATDDPPSLSEDVTLLLDKTRAFRDEVAEKLDKGRDRLLELGSFRAESARALIDEIRKWDDDASLDRYVHDVFDHFGVELEEVSPRTFVFRKGNELIVDDLPGFRGREVAMTSDRAIATRQGELDFLTWDHPMVTGVMELLAGSEQGNSTVAILPVPGPDALLLETVFVLDVVAPPELYVDRFLPPTPLRIVVDQRLQDATVAFPAKTLSVKLTDARQALRYADRSWQDELVPKMIDEARRLANEKRPERVRSSREAMQDVMGKELRRLVALAEVNDHVRPEEIERTRDEIEKLDEAIGSAGLRLDALRLIWKTASAPEP